jgi:hypothetical protein
MTSPTKEVQVAVANLLLNAADVVAIVADTPDGPAVFAKDQHYGDAYPRLTIEAPQRVDQSNGVAAAADMIAKLHAWAKGADSSLVAGELADAAIAALGGAATLNGWRISSRRLLASRPVGDVDPEIEHFVIEYRLTVHVTA